MKLFVALCFLCFVTVPEADIRGTWVSNKDTNWKLVFTGSGKCEQYYCGKLSETDTVIFTQGAPPCDAMRPADSTLSYMLLVNLESRDTSCYEIYNVSAHYLSLRAVNRGGPMLFTRITDN